ncbi:APC amino acid permease, partial [Dentipellis sp. KUC8613]
MTDDDSARPRSIVLDLDDDRNLEALGYVPSFKREFSNLATISFAFSIMGLCSSVATTFNTPLTLGGPSSVTWCWILGACMCFTLGASIAEIVSAFPTCGGLYTASAQLVPLKYRSVVGWTVGWLNILGQVAGLASTEFGLSGMIWAAVVVAKDGNYEVTTGKVVGLFIGLLIFHGILNCLATRYLARFTTSFVFVNLGATVVIIIVLLATTPRHEMHTGSYVFGSEGIVNQTGGWNDGIAFLFGLLSVQWTMTDYDATAHISEEVKRAAYAAPAAIFIAVIGTGLLGWLLNIVMIICSGPLENLPGPSGSAFLEIMALRMGKPAALFLWTFVCLTAFFVCQTALQACSRTVYAFSRDHGLPDRGYFGHVSSWTMTPLRAIWFTTILSILPGLLDFASPVAANAIFSLTAMALDLSYIIPIFFRRVFQNHPEVQFKPGPFYMGDGLLGWLVNVNCILWTLFVTVIFSLPTVLPVTKDTMNYASVITGGVVILSSIWYLIDGHRHYHGPASNLEKEQRDTLDESGADEIVEPDTKKALS